MVMLGSCFAENMGNILQRLKFDISLNPFGIIYHPLPAAQNAERMITGKPYCADELRLHGELWHGFDHHGRFSHPDINVCLQRMNDELSRAHKRLMRADLLFVTFGTARAYRLKSDGRIVANCHKYPASDFEHFRSDADEICRIWTKCILNLREFNPDVKIIFTVSPIRHLSDGAHENQLSKSVLLTAVDRLIGETTGTGYFPAYEIMLDDLRDYRFYDEDMTHPNRTAVNYIWQRFTETYMTDNTRKLMKETEDIVKASEHRPIHRTSACRTFAAKYLEKIARLQPAIPQADFTKEIELFERMLDE